MTGRVTVVGLGPAGDDLLTTATRQAIAAADLRFLRTRRHPSARAVGQAHSFDDLYEAAWSFDEVYGAIVDALVVAATDGADVLYAVPGSPRVAERSVELLVADGRVDVNVLPALSFLDLAWERLGVDPLAAGARLVDGRHFAFGAAGERGPLLVAQCDNRRVLSDVKLAVDDPPESITVLHHLGLPDELVVEVAWHELDRFAPDHLTSLWIPALASPVAAELVRLAELVVTLRARCPWDRQQTHATLTRHLLEETYEVLEAIADIAPDRPETMDALCEELGDLLFQVVFHATLAAEVGAFTLADVARTIHDKLVHRHPHVFGDVEVDGPDDVVQNWEQIKKAEKGRASMMDGIPGALPSLLYAHKVQRKASTVGVHAQPASPPSIPVSDADDVGRALFDVVALARRIDVDPEAALRAATDRFRDRFTAMEQLAAGEGVDLAGADSAVASALWARVEE